MSSCLLLQRETSANNDEEQRHEENREDRGRNHPTAGRHHATQVI